MTINQIISAEQLKTIMLEIVEQYIKSHQNCKSRFFSSLGDFSWHGQKGLLRAKKIQTLLNERDTDKEIYTLAAAILSNKNGEALGNSILSGLEVRSYFSEETSGLHCATISATTANIERLKRHMAQNAIAGILTAKWPCSASDDIRKIQDYINDKNALPPEEVVMVELNKS